MTDTTAKYIFDEGDVLITHEKSYAAGVPAMLVSLRAE
jgi:formate dehydrogenase major subunit